jgi:hypothetical protein
VQICSDLELPIPAAMRFCLGFPITALTRDVGDHGDLPDCGARAERTKSH